MSKKKNVRANGPGISNSSVIAAFNTPSVTVGEKDGFPSQRNLLFDRSGQDKAIAVSGDKAERKLRIMSRNLLGIAHKIAKMNYLLGLVAVNGGVHAGQGTM